jgi:hypothetical protein
MFPGDVCLAMLAQAECSRQRFAGMFQATYEEA